MHRYTNDTTLLPDAERKLQGPLDRLKESLPKAK